MVDRRRSGKAAQAYKVLYFVYSPMPSEDELEDALRYGPGCTFRNAQYVDPEAMGGLENCSAVTAFDQDHVPKNYARYFPEAVTIEEYLAGKLGRAREALDPEQLQGEAVSGMPNDPFAGTRIGSAGGATWAPNTPVT